MASSNTNRPNGFRPVRYLDSSPYNGAMNLYGFSTSQANNAYVGDLMQFDATNRATSLTDAYKPGIPLAKPVVSAVTTTAVRGVIVGFVPQPEFNMSTSASLGLMYRVAGTARYAMVCDDYSVVFEAQEDANGWVSASNNNIGKTADIAYAAGSTTTGISGAQVSSTGQATNPRPFKYLNYSQRVDNFGFTASDTTSYAKFDLLIANSDLAQANVGA